MWKPTDVAHSKFYRNVMNSIDKKVKDWLINLESFFVEETKPWEELKITIQLKKHELIVFARKKGEDGFDLDFSNNTNDW